MKQMRQAAVLQYLRTHGLTSVEELAERCEASLSTIRRDLTVLEGEGLALRVHGGATVAADPTADEPIPFSRVATHELAAKQAIARRAVEHVLDGDVVLLDIGTTTLLVARELRGRKVTVITSSLAVLDELRQDPAVELILLGGSVRRQYHSLVGVLTEDALSEVRATVSFLGTSGVSADGSVLDTTLVEVPIKRAMLRSSSRTVLLADHSKLPGHGTLRVCGLDEIDILITDKGADPEALTALAELGVEVITA